MRNFHAIPEPGLTGTTIGPETGNNTSAMFHVEPGKVTMTPLYPSYDSVTGEYELFAPAPNVRDPYPAGRG